MTSLFQSHESSDDSSSASNEKSDRTGAKYWLLIAAAAVGVAGWNALPPRVVTDAKQSVGAMLKDPASVEFQDVTVCPTNENMVEGYFNAKNSFGAYVGMRPFYVVSGTAYLGDTLTPMEWDGKTYSFQHQLYLACHEDSSLTTDPSRFRVKVVSGQIKPLE